ncbi:MAG TPA: arginase family protein [Mycobacteriales bacterium]|nr:arginase family protein [Mycobacteriales bacterium]
MRPSAPDPRWPRAAAWLADGPGDRAADVAVLGVPTYATSLSVTKAHATPAAVRRALGRLSTWCPSRGVDLQDAIAPVDLGNVDDPDLGEEGEWRVRTAGGLAVQRVPLVLAVGGDNSLTAPLGIGVFGDRIATAGLVTLDAHHDLREGRSNGSPVRRLLEAGLHPERVVQVGIADWANSRSYSDEAHARGVTVVLRSEVARRGIDACVREALDVAGAAHGPVLVDLDLDVCDRSVAPACPAALPGGLSAQEVLQAAYLAGRDERVVAIDVTEVDASADEGDRTVRLAAMGLLEAAAGLAVRLGRATGAPIRR